MKRLTLGGALLALALFPLGALAGTPRATVFSVDARHHTVQVVDAGHLVHAYRYRGRLPRVGLGDTITFRRSGRTLSHVTRTARATGTVSFYAQLMRAGSGTARLRLAEGTTFTLSGGVTLRIRGLTPGATVLIRETPDARRHWTVTITLPPSATSGGTVASGDDPPLTTRSPKGRSRGCRPPPCPSPPTRARSPSTWMRRPASATGSWWATSSTSPTPRTLAGRSALTTWSTWSRTSPAR